MTARISKILVAVDESEGVFKAAEYALRPASVNDAFLGRAPSCLTGFDPFGELPTPKLQALLAAVKLYIARRICQRVWSANASRTLFGVE